MANEKYIYNVEYVSSLFVCETLTLSNKPDDLYIKNIYIYITTVYILCYIFQRHI